MGMNHSMAAMIGGSINFPMSEQGRIDLNATRPILCDDGQVRIAVNAEGETRLAAHDGGALPYQAWLDIDTAIQGVMAQRQTGIANLQAAGLIYPVASIGQTVTLWSVSSDMTPADIDMSGISAGEEDRVRYDTRQVPIPIIHKDFRINFRNIEALRFYGQRVDVTDAEVAARKVMERSEEMLFSGTPISVEGGTIYGYRNFPAREEVTLSTDWLSATPAEIKADVQAMLAKARGKRFYGPFTLYIPPEWEGVLDEDYVVGDDTAGLTAPGGRTIRAALVALAGLESIQVSDFLGATSEAVLVQLTRDVVDLAVAQGLTSVSWETMGGMTSHYKVMAAWVPRLKSDYDGRCGIVHLRAD